MLLQKVRQLADNFAQDLTQIRRYLHQNPELSFQEYQTSAYIQARLKEYGIEHQVVLCKTGVVALLRSQRNPDKKVIALRADIDALPIQEANNVDYCSQHTGIMHACGHDAHTTCLLGAARILQSLSNEWEGTVKLIFQLGEEENPGGASLMIAEGVLDNPRPSLMLGLHCDPDLPVGTIGLCDGLSMASTDEIYLTIHGKGGHGARPHECVDTILLAAQVVQALQQVVSRHANPLIPSVLTLGKIYSDGGATNIIPNTVHIQGTFRTFNETWRSQAHAHIKRIVQNICDSMGGSCVVNIERGYPSLRNDADLTPFIRQSIAAYTTVCNIPPRMGGEDFAFYSQQLPTTFFRLGTQKPHATGLHTPTFDIDENALPVGAGLMAWLAIQSLLHTEKFALI